MPLLMLFLALQALVLTGCGYHFRHADQSYLKEVGIRKIYLRGVKNESFKPGIEPFVMQGITRGLLTSGSVELVSDEKDADAILEGKILRAHYYAIVQADSVNIAPTIITVHKALVATEYEALLTCEFSLRETVPTGRPQKDALFRQTFSNTYRFAGSNQKGNIGSTSPLINESEFSRALEEMTRNMMRDVQESLVSRF